MSDQHTTTDADRPLRVAFLACSFLTTQGHMAIYNAVKSAVLPDDGSGNALLLPLFGHHDNQIDQVVKFKPDIVLVDFPWSSSRYALERIRRDERARGCRYGVIDMYARGGAVVPDGIFDFSIEVEPGACTWHPSMGVVDAWALLNDDMRFQPLSDADMAAVDYATMGGYRTARMRFALVMQSGNLDEQAELLAIAREDIVRRKINAHVVGSLSLPQPAVRFARAADLVYAANGYSTTWELFELGALQKTTFITLDRPVEDCKHRQSAAYLIERTASIRNGGERILPYLHTIGRRRDDG